MLGIYLATVGISTVVQVLSNKSAADTIRRNGYEIDNSKIPNAFRLVFPT